MDDDYIEQYKKIRDAISSLERQQSDFALDLSSQISELQKRLNVLSESISPAELQKLGIAVRDHHAHLSQSGTGATVSGDGIGAGEKGVAVKGNIQGSIYTGPVYQTGDRHDDRQYLSGEEAEKLYAEHIIKTYEFIQLQAIKLGNRVVTPQLEKIYLSLRFRELRDDDDIDKNTSLKRFGSVSDSITIKTLLKRNNRMIILGNAGSGKSTLLAYLALSYARSILYKNNSVSDRLQIEENHTLPIIVPIRDFAITLESQSNPGQDGPNLFLDYLYKYYINQSIYLQSGFFEAWLQGGKVIVLLDGLDEVADEKHRNRVARLIEKCVIRYTKCRFIVTCREISYTGFTRIGLGFNIFCINELDNNDIRQFIHDWMYHIEDISRTDENNQDNAKIKNRVEELIRNIELNFRISELAANPLFLTVIALIHRYKSRLPEHRHELYREAVEVLNSQWDEAKGIDPDMVVLNQEFDSEDRLLGLGQIAYWLHSHGKNEIDRTRIEKLLSKWISVIVGELSERLAEKAVAAFLKLVQERSGLLVERSTGQISFAHLSFQEYLTAVALFKMSDALQIILRNVSNNQWKEVILLYSGYLSTKSSDQVNKFLKEIIDIESNTVSEPFNNLLLAAECIHDIDENLIDAHLLSEVKERLKTKMVSSSIIRTRSSVLRRIAASNALARIETKQFNSVYWREPWGEPEWITIPKGTFWMGSDEDNPYEKPIHQVPLDEYKIAPVPITNAQYAIFVQHGGGNAPVHWRGKYPPKGKEYHPVTNVSWNDVQNYCRWLSKKLGKSIMLPSEAQWEKAARGIQDQRKFPWGYDWDELCANTVEINLNDTSPVGLFINGASPFGVLDMVGNVWEWTNSLWGHDGRFPDFKYPYKHDGRENPTGNRNMRLVARGGAYNYIHTYATCTFRYTALPYYARLHAGFRIITF